MFLNDIHKELTICDFMATIYGIQGRVKWQTDTYNSFDDKMCTSFRYSIQFKPLYGQGKDIFYHIKKIRLQFWNSSEKLETMTQLLIVWL